MIKDIKTLLKNEKLRLEIGMNSRRYVEEEHNINKLVKEYEQVFEALVKKNE
jgi:glycosyltransferase involved in cell wall biosynthesis